MVCKRPDFGIVSLEELLKGKCGCKKNVQCISEEVMRTDLADLQTKLNDEAKVYESFDDTS